jgi:DNA-binding FrmR family transcriptional regulator
VRRIRGQIEAVERALEAEKSCAEVMHLVAAARGAMNGFMAEIVEDHIRFHVSDPANDPDRERAKGSEELIEVAARLHRRCRHRNYRCDRARCGTASPCGPRARRGEGALGVLAVIDVAPPSPASADTTGPYCPKNSRTSRSCSGSLTGMRPESQVRMTVALRS